MSQPWLPDLKLPTLLLLPEPRLQQRRERRVRNNPTNTNHIEDLRWRLHFFFFFVFVRLNCTQDLHEKCGFKMFCTVLPSRWRQTAQDLSLLRRAEDTSSVASKKLSHLGWFQPHKCEDFPLLRWTVNGKEWLSLPRAPNAPGHPPRTW